MKPFLGRNFLLDSEPARKLYHEYVAPMPIFDFHCHLPPKEIAEDKRYDNLGEVWLAGDHYKWRAMRTNGVSEAYCTGTRPWREKFQRWAETVPQTIRNPLYHWTHLELRRYFDIQTVLGPETAEEIYEQATALLRTPEFSARQLMRRMNVTTVCTTDDPVDTLEYHQALAAEGFEIRVVPTFRPDRAMVFASAWKPYVEALSERAGVEIRDFPSLMEAIDRRHAFFHSVGGRLSDHGVTHVPDAEASASELDRTMARALRGEPIAPADAEAFQAAFLYEVGKMNHARGWAQQFHLGVFRNTNRRMFETLGPDTGFDAIGDYRQGPGLVRLLDRLAQTEQLAKTVLYNSHPGDNELLATLAGCFQDGTCPGKIQFGSGWWFLDQKDGMEKQMNALSALGLLSRFIGMLTDSRSFLSYPRHEYFRRILCNLIGRDVENGEIPDDIPGLGGIVKNISYTNAQTYFGIDEP